MYNKNNITRNKYLSSVSKKSDAKIYIVKIHEPVSYEQLRKHFHMGWMESSQ